MLTTAEYINKHLLGKLCLCVKIHNLFLGDPVFKNEYIIMLEITKNESGYIVKFLNKNNIKCFYFPRYDIYNSACEITQYFKLIK